MNGIVLLAKTCADSLINMFVVPIEYNNGISVVDDFSHNPFAIEI